MLTLRSLRSSAHVLEHWRILVVLLGLVCLRIDAVTTVSRIPDLDYGSEMSQFIGIGDDVLVVPELEGGKVRQLAFDGWEWIPVAEHEVSAWLGYTRLHPPWVFPVGEEVLVMDASPVTEGFHTPVATVLVRLQGIFESVGTVSLAERLQDPAIWSTMVQDIVPMNDLLVFRMQVDLVGVGSKLMGYTFLKTDTGWIAGPEKEFARGYWWPLYSQREADGLHLWRMELTSAYGETPQHMLIVESRITEAAWTDVRQSPFQIPDFWGGTHESVRALLSPDASSMVLFAAPGSPSEVPPLVLQKVGDTWTYAGLLAESGVDTNDLHLVALGKGYAFMRRGQLGSVYEEPVRQHYHMLRFVEDHWQLEGDLTSHRPLLDLGFHEVFYALGNDWLTIFDTGGYQKSVRGARSYNLDALSPRLVNWFRDAESAGPGIAYIPAFGYFAEDLSDSPQGIWAYHWNLGWVFINGRETDQFWFWDNSFGWTWYTDDLYDRTVGRHWLYAWSHGDYVLCPPDSYQPRYFFSSNIARWMSDTPAPPMNQQMIDEAIAEASAQLKDTGVTLEVDYPAHVAIFSYTEKVDGKDATLRIVAPWFYETGTGYACQARFELDVSSLQVTMDGETVAISSYDLWTQEQLLLPARLEIHLIFYTPTSGTMLSRTQYNNYSWDPPVLESFGP